MAEEGPTGGYDGSRGYRARTELAAGEQPWNSVVTDEQDEERPPRYDERGGGGRRLLGVSRDDVWARTERHGEQHGECKQVCREVMTVKVLGIPVLKMSVVTNDSINREGIDWGRSEDVEVPIGKASMGIASNMRRGRRDE